MIKVGKPKLWDGSNWNCTNIFRRLWSGFFAWRGGGPTWVATNEINVMLLVRGNLVAVHENDMFLKGWCTHLNGVWRAWVVSEGRTVGSRRAPTIEQGSRATWCLSSEWVRLRMSGDAWGCRTNPSLSLTEAGGVERVHFLNLFHPTPGHHPVPFLRGRPTPDDHFG